MRTLRFTSSQAPNAEEYVRGIVAHLGKRLELAIEFANEGDWHTREQALDEGEIHLGWICGLPYVWKADRPNPPIELLAAPVMAEARYEGRPIYYSDVAVKTGGPYNSFSGLRGARWAYNEPGSHSGYNVVRYHLATIGEERSFFSEVLEVGSHQRALKLILDGEVDAAAIDSSVLETEMRRNPPLAEQIRIIEVLGPSPIPPWVVHKGVPPELRSALRHELLALENSSKGRELLSAGALAGFSEVHDEDYDLIRGMANKAEGVVW